MIRPRDFPADVCMHLYINEALINYAYWLGSDLETYFEHLEDTPDKFEMEVLQERYELVCEILKQAQCMHDTNFIDKDKYHSAYQYMHGSLMYVRGCIAKANPKRLIAVSKNEDLGSSINHFNIINEIEFINNYLEPFANNKHPDFYLTKAIKSIEDLLSTFTRFDHEFFGGRGFMTVQREKAFERVVTEKLTDLEICKFQFTSYAKTKSAVDEVSYIGNILFKDKQVQDQYLAAWSNIVASWEHVFNYSKEFYSMVLDHHRDDVLEDIDEDITEQVMGTHLRITEANLIFNEIIISASDIYNFKNTPLTENRHQSCLLDESFSNWISVYAS